MIQNTINGQELGETMAGGGNPLYDIFNGLKYAIQALKPVPKFKALLDYLKIYRNETKSEIGLPSDEAIAWVENPIYTDYGTFPLGKESPIYKKNDEKKEKKDDIEKVTVTGIQTEKPKEHKMSFLSRVIDFLISPSFIICLSIIACGALAFSPLGAVYVGIAAALAAVGIIYEVAMTVHNYRQIKMRQEERAILEGIQGLEKEKSSILNELTKNCPELAKRAKGQSITPNDFDVNMPKAFVKSFLSVGPGAATVILANALSLNIIGLGIGLASSVLSYTGNAGNEIIYRKQLNKLNVHNESLANEIGEHTAKGRDNDRLLGILNDRKKEVEVLKLMKHELGDRVVTLEEFNKIKAKCMEKANVQEIGFVRGDRPIIQDILGVFFHGFSKHSTVNRMTPVRAEFNEDYNTKIGEAGFLNSKDIRSALRADLRAMDKTEDRQLRKDHVIEEIARRSRIPSGRNVTVA